MVEKLTVDDTGRGMHLEVLVNGSGEDVVLLPSAMRGAVDFALLQAALADAGYRSIALNPRGVGKSTGPIDGITLRHLADDVAGVVEALCESPAHVVGHALGNIVARATATYRPEVVRTLTVMPCGGHNLAAHPVPPDVIEHMIRCHDITLSENDRLRSLGVAFFATGNDAGSWLNGWWPASAALSAAALSSDPEEWWRGGDVPLLIIQPLEDAMASPLVGREIAAAPGDRVTYAEVPKCAHALLAEQPGAVAELLIRFLQSHPAS